MYTLTVESLDQEGRGVARRDGKAVFVEGALPGELVSCSTYRSKPTYELASLEAILRPSALRVAPRCPCFGRCGGCSMQHLEARAQVAIKQRVLEDALRHIGKVRPEQMLPAIHGLPWGYRHRARLTARYVPKKGGSLVGFHERRSSYVTDMASCEVMPPRISRLIRPLRELINRLSIRARLPQIEVAVGEEADVLVLRVLEALSEADAALLREFADAHRVHLYLQPRGPESAYPFHPPRAADLYYALPEFNLKIGFSPTDFTQVNHAVNQVLVRRTLSLLDPQPGERVADMYCGLGNFTLAIARRGAAVVGFESSPELVARATANAAANGLSEVARFLEMDLYRMDGARLAELGRFDRMLVDPPRDGAVELVKALADDAPRRIVYVSCGPATLARDAAVLVHARGYALRAAGIVNMFPHTSHVESIAVFDRG
ncbi:MAG: 23S rRNA (uracil(1939)-C(5))-methyltransferase RlmD [Betaproteobacteria bacterium]|nr:23S rRNA (uracil(1939)-C(5))-methyltransferase RlmD [Betaproteobacteria bacterium]